MRKLTLLFLFVVMTFAVVKCRPQPEAVVKPSIPVAEAPFREIDLNLIRRIACFDLMTGKGGVGTAWMIRDNTLVTAAHVVGTNSICMDIDTRIPITITAVDSENDFAVLSIPVRVQENNYIHFSCKGFAPGKTYIAVGWREGEKFSETFITSTSRLTKDNDHIGDQPFGGVRYFIGNIYEGMSGGPVFDDHGNAIGISSATDHRYGLAFSRDLRDTILCGHPRADAG